MATLASISAPSSVRIDSSGVPWENLRGARIVHVGQSAVVLDRPPTAELVVLTGPSAGLTPGGIQFTTGHEFTTARREIAIAPGAVSLADWRVPVISRIDLTARRVTIHSRAAQVLRSGIKAGSRLGGYNEIMSPLSARAAGSLLAAVSTAAAARSALLNLIGAGPGTTPTGDDVVVGVLAGLLASGKQDAFQVIAAELSPLLERTTRASRHYLTAATRRQFADHTLELLESLSDPRSLESAVERASGWGATSGLDLASGILSSLTHGSTIERAA